MSTVNCGFAVSYQNRTVELPTGVEVSFQLYIKVPSPLGFVDLVPSRITRSPTFADAFAPAFATGATKLHTRLVRSNATLRSTRMVKVSRLVTVPLAGTGAKCRLP